MYNTYLNGIDFKEKFILIKKSLHLTYLKIFTKGLDVFLTLIGHIVQ